MSMPMRKPGVVHGCENPACRDCYVQPGEPGTLNTASTTRAQLVQRMQRAKNEIDQYFSDVNYWNSAHPSEQIDADPDGLMKRMREGLTLSLQLERARERERKS